MSVIAKTYFFPAINKAMIICLLLLCTTASIERTFSTFKRVKTWLRSRMAQERLSGLCMMSLHRKLVSNDQNFERKVLKKIRRKGNKKVKFIVVFIFDFMYCIFKSLLK
ncbi:unnamed protein product [Psylliodes chrysocephalus]|uniref:HAT C-terminal dimerisation domain-containing protein n=1 Tax=Psylliodes chrysocephalus TaxID=3402493 RepID=A0A9P0GLJ0_9CUCU|nr:unnamed protein product [Psylliodes chrysocephala]